jgi:hypothetical protein
MRAPFKRAIGATAVAVAMTLSVAGAASAATHQQSKTPTTLSIVESKTTITSGQTDVISGHLLTGTKPVATHSVYLYDYSHSAKKWVPVAIDVTDSGGKAEFAVAPTTTTEYELVFRGSATLAASHSGGATVLVVRQSTTLSAGESAAVIAPGQSDVISGVLLAGTAPVADAAVRIYRYDASAHQWVLHDLAFTSSAGQVAFTVTPGSTTYYQLVFEGSGTEAASHSGVATVVVTKLPTTLSIAEAAIAISAGHSDYISGYLLTGPTPVAGDLVYLYRYSAAHKKWLPVNVDVTNSAGKVAFTVIPTSTADYELVFHGSASLYSSDSGVAVVTVIN